MSRYAKCLHRKCAIACIHALTFFFIGLSIPCSSMPTESIASITESSIDNVRQTFAQPPMFYAPHAFWFWDAPLDPKLAAEMAKEMTQQRLNPGYAHGRHSGETGKYVSLPAEQWLSPLWFESFDGALKEAEKAGMTLGYCDEYWWPSGQAAGRVLQSHPELAAQSLKWTRQEVQGPTKVQLSASKFTVAGQLSAANLLMAGTLQVIGEGPAFAWQVPQGKWVIYSYELYHHAGIDGGEVNYLDPKLMDVFISMAHQPYQEHFGDKMGRSIPGVFVDNEGDFGWQMAWSDYLAERYQAMKGRDIRAWLPLLTEVDDQGLWAKARYDWFDVVSEVYSHDFFGKLSNWLAARGMHCISNLWEETLMLQTRAVGDFMRAQRSVSMPGTDCLLMKSLEVHDFKETQSVCEFEDRPFMSEVMGVAGWEQTPVQMKMAANAVTAWGVTHVVPHGIFMNRKLETIPYPADWFTENPYWRYLHLWTDFVRRAAFVNRQGHLVADILLVNPLESVWALSEGYFTSPDCNQWDKQVQNIDSTYAAAMNVLTNAQMDYLIADRHYMLKAVVQKPDEHSAITRLLIGNHAFSAIILPPMFILAQSTIAKILDFAQAGGTVVLLGKSPVGSPETGARDWQVIEQMEKLKSLPTVVDLSLAAEGARLLPGVISKKQVPGFSFISGEFPILLSHRKIDRNDFYWLANNEGKSRSCTIRLRDAKGKAEIWDCETGAIRPIPCESQTGGSVVRLDIQPYQGFWLVFDASKSFLRDKPQLPAKKEIPITGDWTVSFVSNDRVPVSSAKTLVTADQAEITYSATPDYDDSAWSMQSLVGTLRLVDTWRASWLFIPEQNSSRYYRFSFELPSKPKSACLNITADNYVKFWVNGQQVPDGPHANSLNTADFHQIGRYLQANKNLIAVQGANRSGPGWLVAQGQVELSDGKILEIMTNPKWKESQKELPGWQNADFDDSAWPFALVGTAEQAREWQTNTTQPWKETTSINSICWRIKVPPAAKEMVLPGLTPKSQIWLDGKEVKHSGDRLALPPKAKLVTVSIPASEQGLSEPGYFVCKGAGNTKLGSWLEMGLSRFTGFVDYETTFAVSSAQAIRLDLGKVLHMAEVWVNGKPVGARLWPSFVFDVTQAVQPGENKLRVRVGNLMVNAMGVYSDLGQLRTWGWRGMPPLASFDAGLFGPVTLLQEE